jgi:hypothetical protein
MIDEAVYTLLTGKTAITDIVSTRIYPEIAPQNKTYPFICFSTDSGNMDYTFDGYQSLEMDDFVIDCWADTLTAAKTLANTVRNEIKNITHETHAGTFIQKIMVDKPYSLYESEVKKYRTSFNITIAY